MTAVTYVSQEEFDAIVAAVDAKRAAVDKAKHDLRKARTLADKIAAKRALAAARAPLDV